MTEFFNDLNKKSDEELIAIANGKIPYFLSAKSTTTDQDIIAEAKAILYKRQEKEKSWHEKPLGKILIGVIIGLILLVITLCVNQYLQKHKSQETAKSLTTMPKPENKLHPEASVPPAQPKTPVLQPDIVCILDEHPTNEQLLIFTIKNAGLATAKLVSVDYLTMRYHWKEQKIKVIVRGGPTDKFEYNEPGRRWLFILQLDPNDHKSKVTGESVDRDESRCVNILYFYVMFRTPEMASREKTAIFFVEDKRIYTRTEYKAYKEHRQFTLIDLEIKRTLAEVPNLPTFGKHKRQ
jgi:hypothetical protein